MIKQVSNFKYFLTSIMLSIGLTPVEKTDELNLITPIYNFNGDWDWDDNGQFYTITDFQVTLVQTGNVIKGQHCNVGMEGRRIDCSLDEFSIVGTVNNNVAMVDYKSFYSDTSGKATIKLLTNGKIEWLVTEEAPGQTFFPKKAILSKQ